MARNASGTYSLPGSNPVVSGTVISSTWANTTLSDLATEMTDSLNRSGKGGMLAALGITDGTVTAPGIGFVSEASSGWWRAASNDIRFSVNGVEQLRATPGSAASTWKFTSPQAAGG